MMNLDIHGGAYRCLMRLRENEGHPVMSDSAFTNTFLGGKSGLGTPSTWSSLALQDMVRAMGLAVSVQESDDYGRVLLAYQSGQAVLVRLDEASFDLHSFGDSDFRTTVLAEMNERCFSVWCPMRNGSWEKLPPITRERWAATGAVGIGLNRI